ncbi:hypothetical protein Q0Z83_066530 [Actinoplanes sichuanensis]|uniref:WxL protein peptidoglycan domain-containing protein n=1 Tax=Actinoplanes sichuanensis TaxID=512349 RepID=A0ABW4AME8_9ACTN|nr:DUF916 domain-containing protein [Actinoplanes sichuanensis]BEL08462.1 hypothetical protein Q0Z83_066530 [Actinoplanes sichuanensis]
MCTPGRAALLTAFLLAVPAPAADLPDAVPAPAADLPDAVPAPAAFLSAAESTPGTSATDALTWSVAPSGPKGPNGRTALDYKLDPGATLTDHVAVTNHSRQPLTLRLYATDAVTTPGGGFGLLAATAQPTGAGAWITPARTTVTLPASSRTVVPFTLTVPGNATPGDHAAGIVASLTEDTTGRRVTVDHRVGTRVHLRVTGPLRPELTVTDMHVTAVTSWNPFRLPRLTATLTVANTGNVRLSAQPSARISGPFGLGTRDATGATVPQILPGGSVRTTVRLTDVPPLMRAKLTVTVIPAAADGRPIDPAPLPATVDESRWLIPWPQLALLALVAALVTAGLLIRRRARRRFQKAITAAEARGRRQSPPS